MFFATLRLIQLILITSCYTSVLGYDFSDRSIRWVNLPNAGSRDLYLVNVTVNNVELDYVPVDTGSTGFLVSATSLNYSNDSELKKCCEPAFEYLSSSRRFYEGYWLPSIVTFKSITDKQLASHIPVFAVTESGNCSFFNRTDGTCTKDQRKSMPTGIQYMGVGFGRWSTEQPNATADKNALLNIDLGSEAIGNGYVISNEGLVVGWGWDDYKFGPHFNLNMLLRNHDPSAPRDRDEWEAPSMCVRVAGSDCFNGTVLFDTGIDYSFLVVPREATQYLNVTEGKSTLLKNGTHVSVKVGKSYRGTVFDFSFDVGDIGDEENITPERVRLVAEHADGAFINTGRFFFNKFSLLFDETRGVVGFRQGSIMTQPDKNESQTESMSIDPDL